MNEEECTRVSVRGNCVCREGVRGKKDGSLRRGKAVTTPRLWIRLPSAGKEGEGRGGGLWRYGVKEEESSSDLSVCPFASTPGRDALQNLRSPWQTARTVPPRRVEMKTESGDFSSRALLAINMKKEMLRRMLHYIVWSCHSCVRNATCYSRWLFIYALVTARRNKKMSVALSRIRSFIFAHIFKRECVPVTAFHQDVKDARLIRAPSNFSSRGIGAPGLALSQSFNEIAIYEITARWSGNSGQLKSNRLIRDDINVIKRRSASRWSRTVCKFSPSANDITCAHTHVQACSRDDSPSPQQCRCSSSRARDYSDQTTYAYAREAEAGWQVVRQGTNTGCKHSAKCDG